MSAPLDPQMLEALRSSSDTRGLRKLLVVLAIGERSLKSPLDGDALTKSHSTQNQIAGLVSKTTKHFSPVDPEELPPGLSTTAQYARLGEIAHVSKGKTGIKDALPGPYPLVVTAESRSSCDHFDFEGPAVLIPTVSSTGHGDASLKRIHFQEGKYAVGSILAAVHSRDEEAISARFLYEYLSAFKDELLVTRMSGTANVSLTATKIEEVPVPLVSKAGQERVDKVMRLCDALEAKGQLEATQHVQLVQTLLGTLTASTSAEELADNWQRVATHFDLLLDRPEAVDALEQTVLQLAVRGLLVPQDPNDEPASELLKKIRAEKDRLIAEGKIKRDKLLPQVDEGEKPFAVPSTWEWVRLGQIADSRLGKMLDKAKNSGKRYPYLRNTNVQWHYIDLSDIKEISLEAFELEEFRLRQGDLLICEGGYPGRCAIWNESNKEMYFQKALHRVRPFGGIPAEFLTFSLEADSRSGALEKYFTGATIKHFVGQALDSYLVPLPPSAELTRIVARVASLRRLCADLRQHLASRQTTQAHLAEALIDEVA